MQHTTSHELSQWAETDRILREDFNSDNAKIEAALADHAAALSRLGNCKIEYGSYTGTGLCGLDRNSLTFSGSPLAVFVVDGTFGSHLIMLRDAIRALYLSYTKEDITMVSLRWEPENGVSWFASTAEQQANAASRTYYYIALLAADE